MENVVVPHCFWQVKFVSIPTDDFTHSVRSRAFVVEHLKWPSCPEVRGREPHFVSNVQRNLLSAGVLHLPLVGFQYVLTESPMSLCQSLELSIRLDQRF
jgi:hypothetical protein